MNTKFFETLHSIFSEKFIVHFENVTAELNRKECDNSFIDSRSI